MSSQRLVRWGVIGLGVGNQHALTLLADPNAQLVAVCDVNPDALASVSGAYGDVAKYSDVVEMLSGEELDAVVVASYDWDHADSVKRSISGGIHVFVEKPVATTQSDYRKIIHALNTSPGIRLTTNTLLRRSPRFAWLKEQIDLGNFGNLVHVQADYLYGRLPKLVFGWRGTRSDYSVTLGGAIHMVDLLLWLVGEKPTSVTAIGSGVGVESVVLDNSEVSFRGDSLRAGLLSFPSGLTASVSANFGSVGPHFHRLDVFGTEATFMNLPSVNPHGDMKPGNTGIVLHGVDPGTARVVDVAYPDVPKSVLLQEFNQAILGIGPTPVSEQEVMDALAVCLALDESVCLARPTGISYSTLSPRVEFGGA